MLRDDDDEWGANIGIKGGRGGGGGGARCTTASRRRSPVGIRKRNRLFIGLVWIAAFVVFIYRYYYCPAAESRVPSSCPETATIAKDILVVLRTGATEALEKLPVHFETTLRCVPGYVVYSDLDEEIAGHRVHDVFADSISEALKESRDLRFYHHLRKLGRQGLMAIHTSTKQSLRPSSPSSLGAGSLDPLENPAWKLDRFKFLPMVEKARKYKPSAKWFVFIEADTYLVWENLVSYLSLFDATQPLYIGKHMYIGDVLFAHGGSGFVLSGPAMRRVVEQRNAHVAQYDAYTAESGAGDMVLGKILADVHIPLSSAFPHFQGDSVTTLDGNVSKIDRRPWCYAPITYHHMRNSDIRALWDFELSRRQQQGKKRGSNALLRHADVFKHFILPQLLPQIDGWDNFSLEKSNSSDADAVVPSFADCKAICEANPVCLQFSYSTAAGKCATSTRVILGEAASRQCVKYSSAAGRCVGWQGDGDDDDEGSQIETTAPGSVQSGWMVHRLQRYVEEMDSMCGEGKMNMWAV